MIYPEDVLARAGVQAGLRAAERALDRAAVAAREVVLAELEPSEIQPEPVQTIRNVQLQVQRLRRQNHTTEVFRTALQLIADTAGGHWAAVARKALEQGQA